VQSFYSLDNKKQKEAQVPKGDATEKQTKVDLGLGF
jgi:hypothetical protein